MARNLSAQPKKSQTKAPNEIGKTNEGQAKACTAH
jgi:hypothetical protein